MSLIFLKNCSNCPSLVNVGLSFSFLNFAELLIIGNIVYDIVQKYENWPIKVTPSVIKVTPFDGVTLISLWFRVSSKKLIMILFYIQSLGLVWCSIFPKLLKNLQNRSKFKVRHVGSVERVIWYHNWQFLVVSWHWKADSRCWICPKLTTMTPEQHQLMSFGYPGINVTHHI